MKREHVPALIDEASPPVRDGVEAPGARHRANRVAVHRRKPRVAGWSGRLRRTLRMQMHLVLTGGLLVVGLGVIAALMYVVGNDGRLRPPPNRFDELLRKASNANARPEPGVLEPGTARVPPKF